MWKCVKCSAVNESGANFCEMCGTPRAKIAPGQEGAERGAAARPAAANRPQTAPGQESAGREQPRTAAHAQIFAQTNYEDHAPRRKKYWIVAAIIALAVVLIVGAGAAFMEMQYRKADGYAQQGKWEQAYQSFDRIGWYRDSDRRAQEALAMATGDAEHAGGENVIGGSEANEGAGELTLAVPDFDAYRPTYAEVEAAGTEAAPVGEIGDATAEKADGSVNESAEKAGVENETAEMDEGTLEEYGIGMAINGADAQDTAGLQTVNLEITDGCIAAGAHHTVGVNQDGTVTATGENGHGQCSLAAWRNITAVSAGNMHTVGLTAGGTVMAAGDNTYGQCDVSAWSDIVEVSAGGYHTLGVKTDGTVVAAGTNIYGQCDVNAWSQIASVSAGYWHTVGVRRDGSVVAVGYDEWGQCDVSGWSNIVQASAGRSHTVGVRADGTVVAAGCNEWGQCDVNSWTDIVAVKAGVAYTVGLKSDGTLVTAGYCGEDGRCDVNGWSGIAAIAVGGYHTVGVAGDGSVMATGWDADGACGVSEWQLGGAE